MRPVKLQTLVDNVDEANRNRWDSAHHSWIIILGHWVYKLALQGKLYTKNPKGEIIQIKVRRR